MGHCGGGSGSEPTDLGRLRPQPNSPQGIWTALERCVETGIASDAIIATQYKTEDDPESGIVRTRPVCRYPMVARWIGTGSVDDAANDVRKAPGNR